VGFWFVCLLAFFQLYWGIIDKWKIFKLYSVMTWYTYPLCFDSLISYASNRKLCFWSTHVIRSTNQDAFHNFWTLITPADPFTGISRLVFGWIAKIRNLGIYIYIHTHVCGFDPWIRKIPWRRKWQATPVFSPGESHGQRSLAGYTQQDSKESDTTEATEHVHICDI